MENRFKLWSNRIFENDYLHALMTSLVVSVMFVLLLFICHITPMGDSTWLVYDMKRQYADFYSYFKSILDGYNNIFYSFSMTLGSGSLGLFLYYLSSPLLLALKFVDETQIPSFISIIIGIKLMLSGAGCDLFLRHYIMRDEIETKDKHVYTTPFAISYAFCAYMISNCVNPMWLEVYAMMPIVLLTLDRLLAKNKKIGYIVSLAFMIWCNYYIAFMVCLFIVMWTMFRIMLIPKNGVRKIIRVAYCSLLSIGLNAVALLPTVVDLNDSPKDIFSLGLKLTKGNLWLRDIVSKLWFFTYDRTQTIFGTPLVYAGVGIVFLTSMYFFNTHIKRREKIYMGGMMVIFLLSFCFDSINLIWHAGMEPSGYPYREAFIFIFLCIICSCQCFNCFEKGIDFRHIIIALAIVIGLFVYSVTGHYPYLYGKVIGINVGIISALCVIFIIFEVCCTKENVIKRRLCILAVWGLLILQFAELLVNGILIYRQQTMINMTAQSQYSTFINNTKAAIDVIQDDGFYRIENMQPREQNDAMMFGYNGVTHYSSAGDTGARYLLQKIGYNDDRLYTDYGQDNTATADSILGIKYVLNAGRNRDEYVDLNKYVKSNPYVLSTAILCDKPSKLNDMNPFLIQEKIYSDIIGEKVTIFSDVIEESEEVCDGGLLSKRIVVRTPADGYLYMYADGIEKKSQNISIYVNDGFKSVYGNLSSMKVVNLGYYNKGDQAIVNLCSSDSDPDFGDVAIVQENIDNLAYYYDNAKKNNVLVEKISSSKLRLSLPDNYRQYEGIVTTIPYDVSWRIICNDKSIKPELVYDAMMYIPISEITDDEIILKYVPKGLIPGAILSILSVIAIVILYICDRKRKKCTE